MAIGYKKCKVCGKEYEYCRTERRVDLFRWQDVACSPEHGAMYFAKIEASRAPKPAVEVQINEAAETSDAPAVEDGEDKKAPAKSSRKKQS